MVEAGQSRQCSAAAPASTKSVSFSSKVSLPATKDIRHAPVVSSRVTENQKIAGARVLRQLDVPRHHVVLHAEAPHQARLAAAEGLEGAGPLVESEDAVRLE